VIGLTGVKGTCQGRARDVDDELLAVLSGNGTVLVSNGHIHNALLELVRDLPFGLDYQALRT
jgi:histidinol-phosphatase